MIGEISNSRPLSVFFPPQHLVRGRKEGSETNQKMESEEMETSPTIQFHLSRSANLGSQTAETKESFLSPGFRSTVAMAGWDEESLIAGLVVQDTPERESVNHKKRTIFPTKTPPTDSRRKRRARRKSSISGSASASTLPIVVLSLEDDEPVKKGDREGDALYVMEEAVKPPQSKTGKNQGDSGNNALPCIDQLKEELSCAICLEICFEPSTTPCGHSFCMKCLKSAANKCGKRCPKCRQTIGNGRSCTVNTVLWNTIKLLFPKEVEARKATMPVGRGQSQDLLTPDKNSSSTTGRRSPRYNSFIMSSELVNLAEIHRTVRIERPRNEVIGRTQISRAAEERSRTTRGSTVRPSQSEDAALALRMQREEFLGSIMETRREVVVENRRPSINSARDNLRAIASRASINSARDNLRAIASRAIQIRTRSRT